MATEYNLGCVVGQGFPVGGNEGQALIKNSGQNFDARWGNPTLEETDPTVPAWAKAATKPSYTAAEVGAAVPAKQIQITLTSSWPNGTQTISDDAIQADSPGDIGIAQTATAEEYRVFSGAMLQVTAQAAGSVTLTARGSIPAIAIPVVLEIRG